MFEVLPPRNPVILCFGWWFWEVVLKVVRIDVSKNVPQHLAVLYVLPAVYLLGRLECLYPFQQGRCQLGWGLVCHVVATMEMLYGG